MLTDPDLIRRLSAIRLELDALLAELYERQPVLCGSGRAGETATGKAEDKCQSCGGVGFTYGEKDSYTGLLLRYQCRACQKAPAMPEKRWEDEEHVNNDVAALTEEFDKRLKGEPLYGTMREALFAAEEAYLKDGKSRGYEACGDKWRLVTLTEDQP